MPEYLPAPPVRDPASQRLLDITRAGQRLVAVGARGLVILSENDGQSWRQVPVPVSATLTAVHFADATHGWAVGHAGVILATRDGGQSWELQFDGERANAQAVAWWQQRVADLERELGEAQAAAEDDEPLLDALDEAGFALDDALANQQSGPVDPFLDVLFLDARQGLAVGAYGMLYHTRDGGEQWQLAIGSIDNPDRFHYYALYQHGERLYLSGEAGLLYTADRSSLQWQRVDGLYEGSLFGLAQLQGDVVSFGLRGHVFRAIDDGQQWQGLLPSATRQGEAVTATFYGGTTLNDGRLLLVGAGGVVMVVDADGTVRRYQHPSRATLSAAHVADGKIFLVGMRGVASLSEALELDQADGQ